jgi:hypothetical protein
LITGLIASINDSEVEDQMNLENKSRKIAEQSPMTWAGILGAAALLAISLGLLIYFFLTSA